MIEKNEMRIDPFPILSVDRLPCRCLEKHGSREKGRREK